LNSRLSIFKFIFQLNQSTELKNVKALAMYNRVPHVLIVEDDPIIAADYEAMVLDECFVPCGPASDSREALAMLDSRLPDVALIDLHLRDGRTGPWIARQLAARGVRLIVVSDDRESTMDLADLEFTFAQKPVSHELLRQMLITAGRRSPPRPLHTTADRRPAA
jgi:two-component system, response regulator PdtaR